MAVSSPGFSTLSVDRPPLNKSASDSNLGGGGPDAEPRARSESDYSESPDLNTEVAALSNKLISAINHQTKLDDSLSATKHELEISQERVRQLEQDNTNYRNKMARGLLLEKHDVDVERQKLLKKLSEESMQRGQAEKDKRNIEQELENLTTALFDEANKMVSAARRERDSIDRRNDQLRAQLADTESLLASHQEQLAELKAVMQQMTAEREESDSRMSMSTPPTPSLGHRGSKDSLGNGFETLHMAPGNIEEIQPCPPTALTTLLHPVLRHDIIAYNEFCEVLHAPKIRGGTSPMTRLSGGSFSSIQVMGMVSSLGSPHHPSPGYSTSLFGGKGRSDASSVHHSPTNSVNDINILHQQMVQALKDTKFYKRSVIEDIDPTLRLETAPGLSWLARRNVQAAITDGSLIIDPMPTSPRVSMFPCALCGESRPDEQRARTHRMRINDSDSAQRYPLCAYCVTRLRSVCDFIGFLKTLKEGLWKCESEDDEKHAWEEGVKLRERMFWARMGGGVVPAYRPSDRGHTQQAQNSELQTQQQQQTTPPRTPVDDEKLCIPKRRSRPPVQPFLTPENQPEEPEITPSPLNIASPENQPEGPEATPSPLDIVSSDGADKEEAEEVLPESIQCPPSPMESARPSLDDDDSNSVIHHTAAPPRPDSPNLPVPGGW